MKIWSCNYSLKPSFISKGVKYSSSGVLLKYEDETFSLYHPIETMGDVNIEDFLKALKNGGSALTQKVLDLRCQVKDFEEVSSAKLMSYYSAPSFSYFFENIKNIENSEFRTVKLKVSSLFEIEKNLPKLENTSLKYIFDFNGREVKESFENIPLRLHSFFKEKTLYLEDPSNDAAPLLDGVVTASDFIRYAEEQAEIKVLKPTGFNHKMMEFDPLKSVVTSYLDHPLGQMIAALWAVRNGIKKECGLHSHTYYEQNEYSSLISKTAFFDFSITQDFFKLLENEEWKEV